MLLPPLVVSHNIRDCRILLDVVLGGTWHSLKFYVLQAVTAELSISVHTLGVTCTGLAQPVHKPMIPHVR